MLRSIAERVRPTWTEALEMDGIMYEAVLQYLPKLNSGWGG